MLQFKFGMPKRELDLPLYSLSEKKSRQKSCFVDSNRVDTVQPAIIDKIQDEKPSQKTVGNKEKP